MRKPTAAVTPVRHAVSPSGICSLADGPVAGALASRSVPALRLFGKGRASAAERSRYDAIPAPRSRARASRSAWFCLFCVALCCLAGRLDAQSISTASPITYPTPTIAHYDAGSGPTHRITVSVSGFGSGAPGDFQVQLRALATGLGNGKPIGHVRFMRPCGAGGPTTGCDTWYTLSTSFQNIVPTTRGDFTFAIDFQITSWSWSADTPFAYAVDLEINAFNNAGGKTASTYPKFQVQVNSLASMSLSSTSLTYPTVAVADFNTGWIQAGTTTSITTKANVAHTVVVKAMSTNFTSTNASASIPASDQEWSTDAGGSWSAWRGLSTTNTTVVSRSAGNYATPFSVRHRHLLAWTRSQNGTHTLGVDYAIQQQ